MISYNPATGMVSIVRRGGQRITFARDKLSPADRDWLEASGAKPTPATPDDHGAAGPLLEENFDRDVRRGLAARLLSSKYVRLEQDGGRMAPTPSVSTTWGIPAGARGW